METKTFFIDGQVALLGSVFFIIFFLCMLWWLARNSYSAWPEVCIKISGGAFIVYVALTFFIKIVKFLWVNV